MSKIKGIINDGYTEKAYLSEVAGIHPEVRFKFRPMLIERFLDMEEAFQREKSLKVKRQISATYLEEQLVEWDLRDDKDQVVSIKAPLLIRLKPLLYNKIFAIVVGDAATEQDPTWDDEERTEDVKKRLAMFSNETPESTDPKN